MKQESPVIIFDLTGECQTLANLSFIELFQ